MLKHTHFVWYFSFGHHLMVISVNIGSSYDECSDEDAGNFIEFISFGPDIPFNFFFFLTRYSNQSLLASSSDTEQNIFVWTWTKKSWTMNIWKKNRFFFFFSGGYISMWNCQWNVSYNKCIKSRKHYIYSKQTWLIGWYIGIYFPSYDEADVKLSVQDWLKNYRAVVFQER